MAVFMRLLVMTLAYVLACGAAMAVFTAGMFAPQWWDPAPSDLPAGDVFWAVTLVGTPLVAGVALLPAMALMAITEGFACRSALIYGILGGGLALALAYGVHLRAGFAEAVHSFPRQLEVVAAAGIAGGFVYWLFAGRNAGVWKAA